MCSSALIPEEDLETTIGNLHAELVATEENIEKELEYLQETRTEYWRHIQQLQKEIDEIEKTNEVVVDNLREAIFRAFRAGGIEIATLPSEIDLRATDTIMGR